jgi:hypothetical protein
MKIMKEKYDTLLPNFKETWTYKAQEIIKSFVINIGFFKTTGALISVPLSLTLLRGLSLLQPCYADGGITLGEYLSCVFSCGACLMIIAFYEYYYLDLIIKWAFK